MTRNLGEKVADGLRLLEACDFAEFQQRCTAEATVWQNDGNPQQTIAERMDQFRSFVANVDELRYDVTRRFENPDEVHQQHVLRLALTDGSRAEIHAAVYFRFDGELISRIEEYNYEVPAES